MTSTQKIKVLYITGFPRSGSTILQNILGEVEGFFGVGEIESIWSHTFMQNTPCGCGASIQQCKIWNKVLNQTFENIKNIDLERMMHLQKKVRSRHAPILLFPVIKPLLRLWLKNYLQIIDKLYQSIQLTTHCKVIVDSSKNPLYGFALSLLPTVDIYILHLVRDPRAVIYSWKRSHLAARPLAWDGLNLISEVLRCYYPNRYLKLRLEDFVDCPQLTFDRILDWLQEETDSSPFLDDHFVELNVNHDIAGNPNRFQKGKIEIKLNEEWKNKMTVKDKILTTLLTLPLLIRYRYPLRAE